LLRTSSSSTPEFLSGHTPPELLTPRQAARRLLISEPTIRQRIDSGVWPGIRVGRLRFIERSVVDQLAERQAAGFPLRYTSGRRLNPDRWDDER
jgi:excisionase family DNA binding protein